MTLMTDWSWSSRMKRPVQGAEQQELSSKFTKHCACHEKWLWWLILVSRETSSTMRVATRATLQLHQILRLPRNNFKFKMSAENPWIVSANIKTIRRQPEHDPSRIRPWNRHLAPAASETLLVPSWRRILYGKIQHLAPRLSPKSSRSGAPAPKSDGPTSPNIAPAKKNAFFFFCCDFFCCLSGPWFFAVAQISEVYHKPEGLHKSEVYQVS